MLEPHRLGYGSVIKSLPRVDKALPVRQRKEGEMDFRTVVSQRWEEPRESTVNLAHSCWEIKSGDHKGTASGRVTMVVKGTYEVSCSTAPSRHRGKEGLGGRCYSARIDPELEQGVIFEERQEWGGGEKHGSLSCLQAHALQASCRIPEVVIIRFIMAHYANDAKVQQVYDWDPQPWWAAQLFLHSSLLYNLTAFYPPTSLASPS